MDIRESLRRFNRKERFLLIEWVLGTQGLPLGDDFRLQLSRTLDLEVPRDAFVAVDYHLDWLNAALWCHTKGIVAGESLPKEATEAMTATQEDVDLLVAFHSGADAHVVLGEAKAYSGWSNRQLKSKGDRLRRIFGEAGKRVPRVQPHFVLLGPKQSQGLKTEDWPTWMKPPAFMAMPEPKPERWAVTRWGPQGKSIEGTGSQITISRWPGGERQTR